jgi:hypothetical protein
MPTRWVPEQEFLPGTRRALTGWQFAPLAKTVAVLLIFDVFALVLATLALRRGLR